MSPIPESKEKNGGKNRKTKRKTKKVQKLKKPFSKKLGGVSPTNHRYFRGIISDYRNRLSNNPNRIPMLRLGYYIHGLLEQLYNSSEYRDYINLVYDIITDTDTIISLNNEVIRINRYRDEIAFNYITRSIIDRFTQIISYREIEYALLINNLIFQENSEFIGTTDMLNYKPEIERTILELHSITTNTMRPNRRRAIIRAYTNFINHSIFTERVGFLPITPDETLSSTPETPDETSPFIPQTPDETPPGTPPN